MLSGCHPIETQHRNQIFYSIAFFTSHHQSLAVGAKVSVVLEKYFANRINATLEPRRLGPMLSMYSEHAYQFLLVFFYFLNCVLHDG
jgi:hypothetical protein